jgi:alcohol dehydrogenase
MDDVSHLRKFLSPEIVFGFGARMLAGRYCRNFGISKALVVSDPGVYEAGWVDDVCNSLEEAGIYSVIYQNVTSNPREAEVLEGASVYLKENCTGIVAIGGGSPMDCAKGIGIVATNDRHILSFEGIDKIGVPGPPMICIPTTAGTASEVSQFSIILDQTRHIKIAIVSKKIIPDVALVDPETTTTMNDELSICTGMDALVHAFEAYVSLAHSPMTDANALQSVKLICEYLPGVHHAPGDKDARSNMLLGSMFAGLAFSNAILGAVHAMAHSLGGLLDLPHGLCNALLLEHVVSFNHEAASHRYLDLAEAMQLDVKRRSSEYQKDALVDKIYTFKSMLGITQRLSDVGVKEADIVPLAQKAVKDACIFTNPKTASPKEIAQIYEGAM